MRIFGLEITKRSSPSKYIDSTKGWMSKMLNFGSTPIPVTENKVLGIASYWRCINLITASIAGLPIKVFSQDSKVTTFNIPAIRALRMPNTNMTAFTYNEILVGSALMYGNGYAFIDRIGSKMELIPIVAENVNPFMFDGEIFYDVKLGDSRETFFKDDIVHLRGFGLDVLEGKSVMDVHRSNLGISLATQRESLNFYSKGTKIDGYIKMEGKLDETIKKTLREDWASKYGINGTGGTATLDSGMEYVRLGMPPADAQFIENGNYSDENIATIFGVPLPLINKLDRATHSNIEQLSIDFVTYCLMPWVRKLEQEYYAKLLTPREQELYHFKFNVNALMRADSKGRAEFYRIMINAGAMTRGEVRKLEDLDPIKGDNELYVPLNMIPLNKANEYFDSVIEGKTPSATGDVNTQ